MSLDIAILGAEGRPERQISIGVDDHWDLIEAVAGSPSLFTRMQDYYEDAAFDYEELDSLASEAARLRQRVEPNKHLFRFLGDLQELIVAARAGRKGLSVIAD